jgi:thiol-disulfide isomerase/thioredoxin
MLLYRLKSEAVALLIILTGIGVGMWAHTAPAARPSKAPEQEAKDEQPAIAPKPATEDQANPIPKSPITLEEAVKELNRRTSKEYFDREIMRQPPLGNERRPKAVTVDEVVSAIQSWDQKKLPVADSTYQSFQAIAGSKVLPPGARLYFHDQWQHSGERDKYEYRVWRIQLDVMTGKDTGYTFGVREVRLDRRIALLPAPGYSWLDSPQPASPRGSYSSRLLVFAVNDDRDAALQITLAWTKREVYDLRAVAFDKDGNRYLPVRQGWGGTNADLAMLRFRLDPRKLPADQVAYVGIEGITAEGLKYSSAAALKQAHEKGIEVLPLPEVGKPYEFSLTTRDGKTLESRKLRTKVVLIDCWASWCGPCLREMPAVKKVYETYHNKGLEVIGLSLDEDPKAAADVVKKHALLWPLVVVPPGEEARELWTQAARIESIPRLLVMDRKGILRADLSSVRDLEKIVAGLLAENPDGA